MALSALETIRVAALKQAVKHVSYLPGHTNVSTVIAFAEHFEHYIRTGENKES